MKKLFLALALICLAAAPIARAQTMGIAALVNDDVISAADLENRTSLLLLSTQMEDTAEGRQKIAPQVLRGLIDEKLQQQEAKRLNISVSEAEVQSGIARLAQQNNMPPDQFVAFIEQKGASLDSLTEQLKSTLLWAKIVRQKFLSQAVVTEEEINESLAKVQANAGASQYLLAEIFLPVYSQAEEEDVRDIAVKLVSEVMAGAEFASLARQFSKSASAPQGGDLGWVKRGQLPPALDQKLEVMQPNQITKPVRTADGYTVLLLRDIRTPDGDSKPAVERDRIAADLRQKKLEASARKFLRDLRSAAIVDIRANVF